MDRSGSSKLNPLSKFGTTQDSVFNVYNTSGIPFPFQQHLNHSTVNHRLQQWIEPPETSQIQYNMDPVLTHLANDITNNRGQGLKEMVQGQEQVITKQQQRAQPAQQQQRAQPAQQQQVQQQSHHHTEAEPLMFQCDRCPYQSRYKYHVTRHKKTHIENCAVKYTCDIGEKLFSCVLCSYTCTANKYLATHMTKKHNCKNNKTHSTQPNTAPEAERKPVIKEGEFHCGMCSYKTTAKRYLLSHISKKH